MRSRRMVRGLMAGLIRSLRLKGHDAVQHEGGVGTFVLPKFPSSRWSRLLRANSNPFRPHGNRQSHVAKQSLAIDAGSKKTELPTEKAAFARFTKEFEKESVFRRHMHAKSFQRRDVERGPMFELPTLEHLQSAESTRPPNVRPNYVTRMPAVAN